MSSRVPDMLMLAGAVLAGAVIGWFGRGYVDGSDVSVGDAAETAQAQVNIGEKAAVKIHEARQTAAQAAEEAQLEAKKKNVDATVAPGVGPVSQHLADRLRELERERAAKRKDGVR